MGSRFEVHVSGRCRRASLLGLGKDLLEAKGLVNRQLLQYFTVELNIRLGEEREKYGVNARSGEAAPR